jgi:hypothetical protein
MDDCIYALCVLQKIQSQLFLHNIFPKEINFIIISLFKDSISTLTGPQMPKPGKEYTKMKYTLYKGNCYSPKDHYKNQKGECECICGEYDEIVEYDSDDSDDSGEFGNEGYYCYRTGKYIVFRCYKSPKLSHVIDFTTPDEERFNKVHDSLDEYYGLS